MVSVPDNETIVFPGLVPNTSYVITASLLNSDVIGDSGTLIATTGLHKVFLNLLFTVNFCNYDKE